MNRRSFLKAALATAVPITPITAASYGLYEAGSVKIERPTIPLPNLPSAFEGLRVAFLTDIHHGPFIGLDYIASVVRTTLALTPDLILLGGDYSSKDAKYIGPCFDVLAGLKAPLGVFGVLGNHDYRHGIDETHAGFRAAGITELTNAGVWLTRGTSRVRLGGVDDLWYGQPDVLPAVGDATPADACLIVSHNPDFAEKLRDSRVGLILSGHTHGGQVYVPGYGAPIVPSRYGQKYLHGLVEAPATRVYVSRGLGTVTPPMRYNSRPELTLVTLQSA
ncbi:MAG: putative metallophosphoesterase [Gemmataceae bacterium]|nr:putative metallophosphoesterase [Gemmataceae bacterium]